MSGVETGIGLQIVEWFQSWGKPVLFYALYPLHWIGGEYGYLVLLPVLYWAISKRHGKRLMILALATALGNTLLKFAFARPRPFQIPGNDVEPLTHEEGFGIPSGHTVFGTVLAGYVWYRVPHLWPRVAAVAFAVLMGVSRMVHGVHFPQDVLAGWIIGVLLIVLFWYFDTRYGEKLANLPVAVKLTATGFITVVAFLLTLLVTDDYEGRKSLLSIVGGLAGGLAGFALEYRWVRFRVSGHLVQRVARVVVGLVTTVGLFVGLDLLYDVVVADATGAGALVVYVIRYGLVALYAAVGAPALFRAMRLAGVEAE